MESQEDRFFPADGHQTIVNKMKKNVKDKRKANEHWQLE